MNRFRKLVPMMVAVAVVGSGCGGGGGVDFELGVRKVALSLAFADEAKAEAVDPRVIIRLIPAPPEALRAGADLRRLPTPPVVSCPAAPQNAGVADVAKVGIDRPPAVGKYMRHNSGSLTIRAGVELRLPFPPKTTWTVENVREVDPPPATEDPLAPAAAPSDQRGPPYIGEEPGEPMYEYTVRKTLTSQFVVVDTYRLTSRRLLLLRRETISSGASSVFSPDPPVTFLEHAEVEGHTWRSAGVDQTTGQAMYVDARLESREAVDVCGTLHDAYRISMQERMINLATGETSGTQDDDPNVYHVATQLGGQILREDLHFTQTITTAEGAAVIVWEYVSVQDDTVPQAP